MANEEQLKILEHGVKKGNREAKANAKVKIESTTESTDIKSHEEVPQIFLSYAWANSRAVLAVDQWLRDKGARVLIDRRNFAVNEYVREEIIHWIEKAGWLICFVSKQSKGRKYVELELEIGKNLQQQGKMRIIYFNLDDTILDADHEARLYIRAHTMSFEQACEKLWQGIMGTEQRPETIDLEPFKNAGTNWTEIV